MERKPLMVKLLLTGRYTAGGHYYVQRCTYKDGPKYMYTRDICSIGHCGVCHTWSVNHTV